MKWTTVKVPVELKEKISEISRRYNMPNWNVIEWALSFLTDRIEKPRKNVNEDSLDRALWYGTKIALTIGRIRETKDKSLLSLLEKNVMQVKERLGLDLSYLLKAAEDYIKLSEKYDEKKLAIELTSSLKRALKDLVMWALSNDSEEK